MKRGALDILLIVAVVSLVVLNGAHAPSTPYAYAQHQQIGVIVGTIESGNGRLPHDHEGNFARKPPLYAWLAAPLVDPS